MRKVEKATKEIDVAKIEQEIKESIAKVDWDKIKEQMEEVKKVDMSKLDADMKKLEIEMKDLGPKIEKEMEKAKPGRQPISPFDRGRNCSNRGDFSQP